MKIIVTWFLGCKRWSTPAYTIRRSEYAYRCRWRSLADIKGLFAGTIRVMSAQLATILGLLRWCYGSSMPSTTALPVSTQFRSHVGSRDATFIQFGKAKYDYLCVAKLRSLVGRSGQFQQAPQVLYRSTVENVRDPCLLFHQGPGSSFTPSPAVLQQVSLDEAPYCRIFTAHPSLVVHLQGVGDKSVICFSRGGTRPLLERWRCFWRADDASRYATTKHEHLHAAQPFEVIIVSSQDHPNQRRKFAPQGT